MDSKAFCYFSDNKSPLYYNGKEENCIIDLGLSLRALQPQAYDPSPSEEYGDLMGWHGKIFGDNFEDIGTRGVLLLSKERWGYVKVNMDGVIVGRKICTLEHLNYSTLGRQLEEMFGGQTISGLRLFQNGSEFSVIYKDLSENWRTLGNIPWKEFADKVKRLRIVRQNEALPPFS